MADPFAPFPAPGGEPFSSNDMRYPLIPWAESLLAAPFGVQSPFIGAFGQLIAQQETPVVTIDFPYNINTAYVTPVTVTTGTVTQANSQAVLQTGASSTGSARFNSIVAARYQPGQGKIWRGTAAFLNGAVAGHASEVGVGDNSDGFFFGYPNNGSTFNGSAFCVIRRQNGVDVEIIPRSTWDNDIAAFDPTFGNVYQIRYQWLGYGAIRFYIEDPATGEVSLVHTILYANKHIIPSIFNPSLPLRAKIVNVGNTTNLTLLTASMGLYSEGPVDVSGARFSTGNRKTGITTETSIFTLQNKALFQGQTNRGRMHFDSIGSVLSNAVDSQYRIVLNATLGGSPVFNDISTNQSIAAVDVAGTTVTGGTELRRGPSSGNFQLSEDLSTLEIKIVPGDTLTFAASSFGGAVLPNLTASWREEL